MGSLSPSMRLDKLADMFIDAKESTRSDGTLSVYRSVIDKHIKPDLGRITILEATPERLQAYIKAKSADHGYAAAKSIRTVLSGMLGMAVRSGAIQHNPVKEVEGIKTPSEVGSNAIPLDKVPAFLDAVAHCDYLVQRDEVDLIRFMLGTGFRAGEACGLCWDMVNFKEGKVTVERISKTVRGRGTILQPHPKTEKSRRTISVPSFVLELLRRRQETVRPTEQGLVFPSVTGGVIEVSTFGRHLRKVRESLGYPELTSHSFRKTVASMLHDAGMSSKDIADYLGHSDAEITEQVYIQRNLKSDNAAALIDAAYEW